MTTTPTSPTADLDRILSTAQLPALPQSAIKLLELSRDPDNGPAEFAAPIEADPGLAGQILKFVNSSYFGFSHEISSVKMAITLVGIRTIKNFSLWSAVFSLMPNPKCGPFDLKNLWQDSLRRALFARAMGKMLGLKEAEEAFSAALLQDMAVPLLAKELPKEYLALLEARHDSHIRLCELEQERFGWNHAQAGAKMARSWKMPEDFRKSRRAARRHRSVYDGPTDRCGPTGGESLGVVAVGERFAVGRMRKVRGSLQPRLSGRWSEPDGDARPDRSGVQRIRPGAQARGAREIAGRMARRIAGRDGRTGLVRPRGRVAA